MTGIARCASARSAGDWGDERGTEEETTVSDLLDPTVKESIRPHGAVRMRSTVTLDVDMGAGRPIEIDREVIYPHALFDGPQRILPAIRPDGSVLLVMVPRHGLWSGGLWSCAVCEQLHELESKTCPLATGPTEVVPVGPLTDDLGDFYIVMRVPAGGPHA
jgi:hypothetical protein